MTEQLTFELAPPAVPSFGNFVAGRNREALAMLERVAAGNAAETGVLLWGLNGVGKSHLLAATVRAALERGRGAVLYERPAAIPDDVEQAFALVAVDDLDLADAGAQALLFRLYNALAASGGQLLAAAEAPPARLPLREDLRSRMGWGLAFEVVPLADDEKPAALVAYAALRGIDLPDGVVEFLLARGRRDMASLLAAIATLDRLSLARRRPISVALARAWLGEAPAG